MKASVDVTFEGKKLVALISGELDHHMAKPVREKIDTELFRRKPEVLILDFSGVRFMDSSGIALIIGRHEIASELGCYVQLSGLSPTLLKIVRLSGIERLKNLSLVQSK